MTRALFIDRDGTLNVERHYLNTPDQIELVPGAADAIRMARQAGWLVIVVTNQSGVARGYLSELMLTAIHVRLIDLLAEAGTTIDGIHACIHHPNDRCDCRKPMPGMLHQAASTLDIDLGQSWMIGDNATDIVAGRAAGCKTALVLTGHGSHMATDADLVVDDLPAAIATILSSFETR